MKRILVIDGHPDADPRCYVHALTNAYADAAMAAGHEVRRVSISEIEFPLIQSRHDWEGSYVPPDIRFAQSALFWADHIVILYPLWLGDIPARLKGFLEQLLRPAFTAKLQSERPWLRSANNGKSAHIIVTMGMPALLFKYYFRAHSAKSLERNILRFVGIAPVKSTFIGNVEASAQSRETWLRRVENFGRNGA
jgi:putative NADPH-quinone reductase